MAEHDPIAVIGFSVKFPQQASNSAAFWDLLTRGGSTRAEVPADRYDGEAFYRPVEQGNKTGTAKTKHGHFISESLGCFDAPFFSIAPHEAECMDPQQRWLLESTFHAFENAGLTISDVNGSSTSVYVGCFMNDHAAMVYKDLDLPNQYHATGSASALLANRVSWFYNLSGPSVSVNTACSGSLVALHLACQSIRTRETEMGVVCGSNLLFAPESTIGLSNQNFLSPDGTCYSFDERANGYGRGEGIASLVLKPLSAAIRDGNPVRALVRATGVNSDGRTPGISQPSCEAQVDLIRDTYRRFGIDVSRTTFFEAHGTGTQVGDPIEAEAIATVFTQDRETPIYVGALKSNIGHLEGASGVAGIIKTILALENAMIPPNHGIERINPAIKETWNLAFPTRLIPWPSNALRRASVNSFGFGGTKQVTPSAHAVLDDAQSFCKQHGLNANLPSTIYSSSQPGRDSQHPQLLVLSAFDEGGIQRQEGTYRDHFQKRLPSGPNEGPDYITSLAYTLSERRTHFPWRSYSICEGPRKLRTLEFSSAVRLNARLRLCFVFTGQGAQWPCMGKELLEFDVYRASLVHSNKILLDLGCEFSVFDMLYAEGGVASDLNRPEFCQPLCTVLQIALVDLLEHWNIKPSAVIGHSSGEVAAAYCAGIINKAYAIELAFFRGMAVAAMAQVELRRGGMMAVRLSPDQYKKAVLAHKDGSEGSLDIACYNSPQNLTLSGDQSEIDRLEPLFQAEGIMAKRLNVSIAYHNEKHMQDAANLYRSLITTLPASGARATNCSFVSSLRGTHFDRAADATKVALPDYWVDNLVCPVKFSDGLQKLASDWKVGESMLDAHFLEVGPHSTLKSAIKESLPKGWNVEKCYSSLLVREQSAFITALIAAGRLHCLGIPVALRNVNQPSEQTQRSRQTLTDLPSYSFDHSKQYWLESRISKNYRHRKFAYDDFLGTRSSDWNPLEAQWNNRITLDEQVFIKDHKVSGVPVYPAAGMLVMAIESVRQLSDINFRPHGYRFRNVVFSKMITFHSGAVETQFRLRRDEQRSTAHTIWHDFRLHCEDNGEWTECCRGSIAVHGRPSDYNSFKGLTKTHHKTMQSCHSSVPQEKFYSHLRISGLDYGPVFATVDQTKFGDPAHGSAVVDLRRAEQSPCLIHPGALDCIFQVAFLGIGQGAQNDIPTLVPTSIDDLWLSAEATPTGDEENLVEVSTRSFTNGTRGHTVAYTSVRKNDDSPYLVGDLSLTSIGNASAIVEKKSEPISLYHVEWKPDVDLLSPDHFSTSVQISPELADQHKLTEIVCLLAMSDILDAFDNAPSDWPELPSHLHKHMDWMRHQLDLVQSSDIWASFLSTQKQSLQSREELFSKVASFGPEGKIIVRIVEVLLPIMRGEQDPLSILFSDDTLSDYYRLENPPPEVLSGIQKFVDSLAHTNPRMKILEIGAGTGGMTKGVLDVLGSGRDARFTEYTFTDLSPAFFSAAKKNFGRDGFMCKTLDIEKEPSDQGFEIGSYDLIVASNVLHATPSLSSTLANTRTLLKPGGKLLLVEGIAPNLMRTSFIFGLLHGWWLSTEPYREWGPLVPKDRWNQLLQENAFTGTDLVIDGHDSANCLSSAIISSATMHQEQVNGSLVNGSGSPEHRLVILRSQSSPLQCNIASVLADEVKKTGLPVDQTDVASFTSSPDTTYVLLETIDRFDFSNMQEFGLKGLFSAARDLLWVHHWTENSTENLEQNAVLGLARSLHSESDNLQIVTLGLQDLTNTKSVMQSIRSVLNVYFSPTSKLLPRLDREEIIEVGGSLCVSRLRQVTALQKELQLLETSPRTDVHTMPNGPPADQDLEIEGRAVGLERRNLRNALGGPNASAFGSQYAGVVTKVGPNVVNGIRAGNHVLAITRGGALKRKITCPSYLCHKLPESAMFEMAAAAPLSFLAMYDTIRNWARLQKGESFLVHDIAGSLGHAAIELALQAGTQVFALATDQTYGPLRSKYPDVHVLQLEEDNVVEKLKQLTGGRGVSAVLMISSSHDLQLAWDCVAPFGRVIELDDRGTNASDAISLPTNKGMKNNVFYARVSLEEQLKEHDRMATLIPEAMKFRDSNPDERLEPHDTYTLSSLRKGVGADHLDSSLDKVVVIFDESDGSTSSKTSRSLFHPDATYVITGGLGGLGKSIASWMASRGARNLLLLSRQGEETAHAKIFLDVLRSSGVTVLAPKCDIGDEKVVQKVLRRVSKGLPPIRGMIQASMVLKSAMFQNMTLDQWSGTLRPKIQGSINLHKSLPADLDFTIFLSSVCGIIGASGQSNYAFGCAYQDALARYLVASGNKSVSIDLGIVEGVGYTSENHAADKFMRALGMQPIPEDYVHSLLAYYCDPQREISKVTDAQVIVGIMNEDDMRRKFIVRPRFLVRPLFRNLQKLDRSIRKSVPKQAVNGDTPEPQSTTVPTSRATKVGTQDVTVKAICNRLSDMLDLTIENIEWGKPMHAYGVDSLVAIELRSWFAEALQADVPVFDILSNLSIEALAAKVVSEK